MRGLFISTAIWFVRLVGKLVSVLFFWQEKLLVPSSDSDRVIIKIVNELKKRHVGQFSLLEHPHQWMQNTKCAHIDAKAVRIYQCERLIFESNFFGL